MNTLDKYRKYNTSFIEVIIDKLKHIYDISLISDNHFHVKNTNYKVSYLRYMAPVTEQLENLISIFEILEGSRFLLLSLPYEIELLSPQSKNQAFDGFVGKLHIDIQPEILKKTNFYKSRMEKHDPYNHYPIYLEGKSTLKSFFLSSEEDIVNSFIGNTLLFSLNMEWLMHFDYDLGAIHFIYKDNAIQKIIENDVLRELIFTDKEMDDLINDY